MIELVSQEMVAQQRIFHPFSVPFLFFRQVIILITEGGVDVVKEDIIINRFLP